MNNDIQSKEIKLISTNDAKGMSTDQLLKIFKSDKKTGLSSQEVEKRKLKFGLNQIKQPEKNRIAQFLKKFWGLSAWLMEIIIVISIITSKFIDAYIVFFLLLFNSVIGFYEEVNADLAVKALEKKLQINSRVLRNSNWSVIESYDLVVGDIVRIRNGDYVPADLKIIEGNVTVDESALTGESLDIAKNEQDVVYSGSICSNGECTGIVINTANRTFFGKTVKLIQTANTKIHAEEMVYSVVKLLLIIVFSILLITFVFAIANGTPIVLFLPLSLLLLLGAIPVALPAMFTVSMALGAKELVNKGVLITRLGTPDDAASMNILCVDKTGTITENKIQLSKAIGGFNGFTDTDVLLYSALASSSANNDSIDKAILNDKTLVNKIQNYQIEKFVPFDPKTRMTKAYVKYNGKEFVAIKGASQTIADICKISKEESDRFEKIIDENAENGYRILAVAGGKDENNLKLAGILCLYDKPREDSADLIQKLKEMGIKVKMLTGDARQVAINIGNKVGITGNSIGSQELNEKINNNEEKVVEDYDLFSQIYPADKFIIVKTLQKLGHIVGMTGDGINDAPALKEAEVGIAVINSTDVAKGASSAVLTNSGLENIISLIIVGRQMFTRINNWIIYKISKTILQVFFIISAFLITGQLIISSTAMILMIFMNDFVIISLSTDNVEANLTPQKWDINSLIKISATLGILMAIESLFLLWIGFVYFHLPIKQIQTLSYLVLFFFTIFLIFAVRERKRFYQSKPSTPLLTIITIDCILAVLISTNGLLGIAPISLEVVLSIFAGTAIFSLLINDYLKTKFITKS